MNNLYLMAGIGAIVLELLKIIEGKYNPEIPSFLTKFNFWLAFAGQILIGIFTFYLLKDQIDNAIGAAACGFSGSTILTKLLSKAEKKNDEKSGTSLIEEKAIREKSIFWFWK